MRLFVAIVPPAEAAAELAAALAPLRPAWPALRWAGPDSWHLTLAFLGEVPGGLVPQLCARLERAAVRAAGALPPLSVAGAGAFPTARRGRVLWAGIRAQSGPGQPGSPGRRPALTALAASVAAAARRAGAPPPDEGRRYRPHLTLARCGQPADLSPLVDALAGLSGSAWTPGQVQLIASSPCGQPRYATIGRWPLR